MLRLTELLLFFSPFVLLAIWWLAGRQLARIAWPALALAVVVAGLLIAYGLRDSMPAAGRYVPARVEGGRIVDGYAK